MPSIGTCINKTDETLLVYGPNSGTAPFPRDNMLYRLPAGQRTPANWDGDGIYVPNDREASQAVLPDKAGPVAVKFGVGSVDVSFTVTRDEDEYDIPVNQGIFTPAEVCTPSDWPTCVNWNIPNHAHTELGTYPEVPGHLPARN